MLDGRIDTQGTISDLKSRGMLDILVHEAEAEQEPAVVTAEELAVAAQENGEIRDGDTPAGQAGENAKPKKPKKLVEDEARASGSVKWKVYKTYLKAT